MVLEEFHSLLLHWHYWQVFNRFDWHIIKLGALRDYRHLPFLLFLYNRGSGRRVLHAPLSGALFVCRGESPHQPLRFGPHTRDPVHLLLRWCYVDVARLPRLTPPAPLSSGHHFPALSSLCAIEAFTRLCHNESFRTRKSLYIITHSIVNWRSVSACR